MAVDPCVADTDTAHPDTDIDGALTVDVKVSAEYDNGLIARSSTDGNPGLWVPGRGLVSSLPGSGIAYDGQVIFFQAGNGVVWQFRYNAGSGLANKWECCGGVALTSAVDGDTTYTTSGSPSGNWSNGAATVGPDLVVPLQGVYRVGFGCDIALDVSDGHAVQAGIAQGTGADPIDALKVKNQGDATGVKRNISVWKETEVTLAQGVTLRMRYLNTNASSVATYGQRRLVLHPVRV